jgi:hypothetical protein
LEDPVVGARLDRRERLHRAQGESKEREMSDEQRRDEETEIEAHTHRAGANDEPAEEADDEIEAHVHRVANVRMDSPSNT